MYCAAGQFTNNPVYGRSLKIAVCRFHLEGRILSRGHGLSNLSVRNTQIFKRHACLVFRRVLHRY